MICQFITIVSIILLALQDSPIRIEEELDEL